ncbi:TetR/AcrR family transcriptional regulator [Rhizobium sp. NPDC090279]|uniref:TetR/AcrR family transcriptional regulator n=1 Tax=Rhizobium sp. NPDC090279 TaxID=3364499 RepID=UPI00383AE404
MENMRVTSRKSSEELKTRTPKRQRGHERVVILLEAAARVFARKGYDAATMTEIAAEANSSIGSLYQFFPTKPLLAEALHIERLERLKAELRDVANSSAGLSAADCGEAIFDALGVFMETYPELSVLAGRRDIPKERKAVSRVELKELIAGVLRQAKPSIANDVALMSGVVLELLRIAVVVANEPETGEDRRVVGELRLMLRRRLEEAAAKT